MRWLFGLFLVAHGLIHVAIWLTPANSDAPGRDLGPAGPVTGGPAAVSVVAGLWW